MGQVRTFANAEAHRRVFALEKDIRGRSAEERRLIRQQRGRPLADAFQKWLRTKRGLISQKVKLADAVRYALSRWKGSCFLMTAVSSSTTARRKLHPSIILNRKNALFAGSDGGAEHCAVIASVIETCKLNDVAPLA